MDRGGFAVLARPRDLILDRLCGDGSVAYLQPDGVLDPSKAVELPLPARGVVDLQHERRDQRVAARD